MELVSGMVAFVRVAETRSFVAAARSLGVTASGVGKAVNRLEDELGVRLLHRTTRRVALTDDGAVFLEHCRRVLDEIASARESLVERGSVARGRLRVSIPVFLGMLVVLPSLPAFTDAHPDVLLDVSLADRRVNLVEDGIDLAVRVGPLNDSSLGRRRLGAVEVLTVAAPHVVARAKLSTLGDLAFAPCVAFRQPTTGRERPWSFRVGGREVDWSPRARLVIDSGEGMVQAAIAGLGVTQVPGHMAVRGLADGSLVEILPTMRPAPLPVHAIFLSAGKLPPRTRAFLSFLAALPGWKHPRG